MAAERATGRSRTAAKRAAEKGVQAPEKVSEGRNAAKVQAFVSSLTLDGHGEALAALALTLAASLDDGAGLAVAAVSRELRATLAEMVPPEDDDDDPLLASLQSPVVDT